MGERKRKFFNVADEGDAPSVPAESSFDTGLRIDGGHHAEDTGDTLRNARLRTGLDLRDVAATLRIRYVYLQAIEDGRYSDLPGTAYAVGFLRSYADYLQIDSESLIQRFKEEASSSSRQPEFYFPTPVTEGRVPGGTILLTAVVLAGLAYGGWYYLSTTDRSMADLVPTLPERLVSLVDGISLGSSAPPVVNISGSAEGTGVTPVANTSAPSATTAELASITPAAVPPAEAPKPEPTKPEATKVEAAKPETAKTESGKPDAKIDTAKVESAKIDTAKVEGAKPESAKPDAAKAEGAKSEIAKVEPGKPDAAKAEKAEAAKGTAERAKPSPESAKVEPAKPVKPEPAKTEIAKTEERPTAAVPAVVPGTASPAQTAPAAAPTAPTKAAAVPVVAALPVNAAGQPPIPPAEDDDETPLVSGPADENMANPAPLHVAVAPPASMPANTSGLPATPAVNGRTFGAPGQQESRILIRATQDSWVQIRDANGEVMLSRVLRPGDVFRVPDKPGLKLRTGNAGGLAVTVDGKDSGALGASGQLLREVSLETGKMPNKGAGN